MDDELLHILFEIDRIFDYLMDRNFKKINNLNKNYPYMDHLDYVYELEIIKEEYLFQLNELMTYTRALKDKIENG
jgi:hypothetical protein